MKSILRKIIDDAHYTHYNALGGRTMKLIYPAVFYPFSDGSGGYVLQDDG